MKKIGLLVLFVVGLTVLWFGRVYWLEQVAEVTGGSQEIPNLVEAEEEQETPKVEEVEGFDLNLAGHLPELVVDMLSEGEVVRLALVARNEEDWAGRLKGAIVDAYGQGVWEIDVLTYEEMISAELNGDERFTDLQADVVLFEMPVLNDNLSGAIDFDGMLGELTNLLASWDDSIVMLHSQNPVYQGVNYPLWVEAVANVFRDQGFIYLNHWQNWPDFNSEEILPYLDEEGLRPSEAGSIIWYEYLLNKFVAE